MNKLFTLILSVLLCPCLHLSAKTLTIDKVQLLSDLDSYQEDKEFIDDMISIVNGIENYIEFPAYALSNGDKIEEAKRVLDYLYREIEDAYLSYTKTGVYKCFI